MALEGLAKNGLKIHNVRQNRGVIFVALISGSIHVSHHQRRGGGPFECLCLIVGVGIKEVGMLIYANILKSETRLLSSEIRINDQQNRQNL